MLNRILKSVAPLALAAMAATPLVAQIPLPPLPGLEIRVSHSAPPPLRQEDIGRRPSQDHVWARGSWDWQGDDWAWAPGRWQRPERRGARWIQARYVREDSGYRYEPAHWSYQRVIEGEDYRRWKTSRHADEIANHDNGRGYGRGHDKHDEKSKDKHKGKDKFKEKDKGSKEKD